MHHFLKALLLALALFASGSLWAFAPSAQLKLESTEWGDADPADIKAVLDSTLTVLAPYTVGRNFGNILIKNSNTGPISIYEKGPNGEYIIMLNVHGRYWAQLAYQFSHELCHLMSNYDLAPNNRSGQQWFEESLCEAFSLFTLKKLAEHWQENPPYPHWREYAPKFMEYRDTNLKETHRTLPSGMTMPAWYQQYQSILSRDPYAKERDLNELAANQLLKIFEEKPENWSAINFLNLGEDSKDKSLYLYLTDWQDNNPDQWDDVILKIKKLLLNVDI